MSPAAGLEATRDIAAAPGVDVVAIGASAGGVSALGVVLGALPIDLPVAVVVVQHVERHRRNRLSALLSRCCRMPVAEAVGGQPLERTHVYLAPPDAHLVLHGWRLELTDTVPVHFSRPSVDILFASVAETFGPHALGVILTGAGRDGAAGLRAIKEGGGATIVEDPASAEYDGMPGAAQATGCADQTLPLHRIGPAIVRLVLRTGESARG